MAFNLKISPFNLTYHRPSYLKFSRNHPNLKQLGHILQQL